MDDQQLLALIPDEFGLQTEANSLKNLEVRILQMLTEDQKTLMNLLYRIDISEDKLRKAFELKIDKKIASEITFLVIERLNQKLIMRNKYKST